MLFFGASTYIRTSYWKTWRKLFIAKNVTKLFHPYRSAVIADTVQVGYEQITSYCRYVKKVESCRDNAIIDCFRCSNKTL